MYAFAYRGGEKERNIADARVKKTVKKQSLFNRF